MKQAETKFKERILPRLKALPNSWVLKTQELARRGVPDILMCLNGSFIAIELKTDKGSTDKLQDYVLSRIDLSGGLALVVTESSWPEHYSMLQEMAG